MNSSSRLAIEGGKPAKRKLMPPVFPGAMVMDKEEEKAVIDVIRSKRLFRYYGPKNTLSKTAEFEKTFAQKIGVTHARAVSSGTAALICALVAAEVGPGDEVIIPAFTWISTASAVVMVGAIPIITEIDRSLTLDLADVQRKITKRTRAIIPVHIHGASADMNGIMSIAKKNNIAVIEDVAQATGGSYYGQHLGSIGDIGAFSLQFNKIITTGEGGVITTNDRSKWLRASTYHDPINGGMGRDFTHEEAFLFAGQNYRANEFIGALGLVQLRKLDNLILAMCDRKKRLLIELKELSFEYRKLYDPNGDIGTNIILFLSSTEKAKKFSKALTAENVPTHHLYTPEEIDYHVYAYWDPILHKESTTPANFPWN